MSIRFNYQEAALRVCVDKADNGAFCGQVVGPRIKSAITFSDLSDFVIKIDSLLDMQKFPQAFQRIRSFTDKPAPTVPGVEVKEEIGSLDNYSSLLGASFTFSFIVVSRQNATWQGYIDWLDGTEKSKFNSTLEFMKLVGNRIKA